jgi:hypothetical protein
MKLTTEQKVYGGILALAAFAFMCDRAFFAPAEAEANSSADLLIKRPADAKPGAPVARGARAAAGLPSTLPILGAGHGLAQRLAASAKALCLDVNCPDDAFALAPIWWATKAPEVSIIGPKPKNEISSADRELAANFARHTLDAVFVSGQRGYAIIDRTEGVYVNETFDNFKLVSVTKTSATFIFGPVRVDLHLQRDPKLRSDSGVIDNRARGNREEIKQKD